MSRHFKVEIRTTCKVCGDPLPPRYRTFCSKKCRQYETNQRHKEKHNAWLRKKKDAIASIPAKNKIQCLICGKWYRQVGSHIVQVHKMTARDYRKLYGFDVKKGQLPNDLRKLKSIQAIEGGGYKNLKKGKKFWFKPNDPKAGNYDRSQQTLDRLKIIGTNKVRKKLKKCLVCGKKLKLRQVKYCSRKHRQEYNKSKVISKVKLFKK